MEKPFQHLLMNSAEEKIDFFIVEYYSLLKSSILFFFHSENNFLWSSSSSTWFNAFARSSSNINFATTIFFVSGSNIHHLLYVSYSSIVCVVGWIRWPKTRRAVLWHTTSLFSTHSHNFQTKSILFITIWCP